MKTLKKILSGIALTSALLLGYNANAQIKPVSISTETSIVENRIENKNTFGIPMQRVEINTEPVVVKYDSYFNLKGKNPDDVASIFFNKVYNKKDLSLDLGVLNVGNFNGKDELFFDVLATKKVNKTEATLEVGKSTREIAASREWVIVYFRNPKISADAGYFAQGSTFNTNTKIQKYAWLGYHDNHKYIALGNEIDRTWGFFGVKGYSDFGTFTLGKYDRNTGDVWIKSQTAVGDVNQKFYCTELFDVAASYFVVPAFHTKHFSPLSTKGDVALKLEYKKNGTTKTQETEAMIGTNKTPIQIGLGINTEYKDNSSTSNAVVELYKEFKIGKIDGSAECRYNNRTEDVAGYLMLKYKF